MLDNATKRKIDSARQILVGKVPDPKAQVEQITTALVYKFMDDMDKESEELGGQARFFANGFGQYSWTKLMDNRLSGQERLELYAEAIANMSKNPHIPQLFRDIFKGAFLPFRDPRTLSLFLKEINEFNYDHSENLGNAFEYLLSILGSQGDAGQFRTPRHIIDFIVEVVNPKKNETILDPACGTAGFLISAYKHILKNNSSNFKPDDVRNNDYCSLTPDDKTKLTQNIAGYDISPDMVKLALVNLYLHGFSDPKIFEYDTLSSDKRWDEHFDVILANPPFMTPKGGIVPHKRFSIQANRAEVLFVDYIAEHLSIKGRAGIIVPEGIIFQSANAYKNLRKNLIENWGLYAVVSLPSGVFQPYSGVKTSILLMDREFAKRSKEILFLKVENDGFDLGAQRRKIDKNDLPKALEVLNEWKTTPLAPLVKNPPQPSLVKNPPQPSLVKNPPQPSLVREGVKSPPDKGDLGGSEKEFVYIPYNQKLTELARENRKNPTKAELKMWNEVLRGKNFSGYKFHRQKPLDNFIADFYCSKLRLIIEIDGDSHVDKKEYDEIRTEILNQYGLTVVRYTNDEVLNNIEGVYDDLMEKITHLVKNPPLPEGNKSTPALPYQGGSIASPPDKGDLGGLKTSGFAFAVAKEKIAENGDYNLTGDRYREVVDYSNVKWEMVELGEVCEIFADGDWIESKDQSKHGIRLIQTGNVGKAEYLDKLDKAKYISEDTFKRLNCTEVFPNDLLVSRLPDPVGRACLVPKSVGKAITAVDCTIIRPDKNKTIPEFLLYLTKTKNYFGEIEKYLTGASRKRISRKNLAKIKIPLPPLEVQEQIVAEIEQYQKVIIGAKQVVENWKPNPLTPLSGGKVKDWEMVELGEVLKRQSNSVDPQKQEGNVKYIGLENIESNTGILVGEIDTKYQSIKSTKTVFGTDQILYGKLRPNLNKVFYSDFDGICSTDIFVLQGDKNTVNHKFYAYFLRDKIFNDEVLQGLGGAQLPRVSWGYLSAIKIPLPPLEVQEQIVAEIEAEQKIMNANKELMEKMEKKVEAKIGEVWGEEI